MIKSMSLLGKDKMPKRNKHKEYQNKMLISMNYIEVNLMPTYKNNCWRRERKNVSPGTRTEEFDNTKIM